MAKGPSATALPPLRGRVDRGIPGDGAADPARRWRGRRGCPAEQDVRQDDDHDRLGPGGGAGRVRLRAIERRAHQPGRDSLPGRSRRIPPVAGAALLGCPARRRLRRCRCWSMSTTARRSGPSSRTSTWSAGRWKAANSSARRPAGRACSRRTRSSTIPWRNVLSEFLGTAVLLLGVRALTDRRNAAPGGYVEPLALGGLVWAIGLSLGGLTGYAINPARDLGPRLASALLGWGTTVFQSHGNYFWIPIVVPLVGGPRRDLPVRLRHPPPPAAGRRAQPARRALALIVRGFALEAVSRRYAERTAEIREKRQRNRSQYQPRTRKRRTGMGIHDSITMPFLLS